MLDNRRGILLTIAIYQALGGLLAAFLMFNLLPPDVHAGVILVLIPIAAICLISFFAGIVYFFKGETTRFFLLSKLNFCFQIIQFSLVGLTYYFNYGFYLTAGMDGNYTFIGGVGLSAAMFGVKLGPTDYSFFQLNLFPLIPLIILRWAERNPKQDPTDLLFADEEPIP